MDQNSAAGTRGQLVGLSTAILVFYTLWMTVHNRIPEALRYAVDCCGNVENCPYIRPQRRIPAFGCRFFVDNPVDDRGNCPHRHRLDVGDSVIHISTRLVTTTISFQKSKGALYILGVVDNSVRQWHLPHEPAHRHQVTPIRYTWVYQPRTGVFPKRNTPTESLLPRRGPFPLERP